jgi:hypothetical protein
MREESPNGGGKQWLTSSEWAAVAYLDDGENATGKRKLRPVFSSLEAEEKEREWSWSHMSVSDGCRLAGPTGMWCSTALLSQSDLLMALSVGS